MTGEAMGAARYEHLMADRELLTTLMEAAANGKPDELRAVAQKIEARYAGHCKEGGGEAARLEDLLLGFRDGTGRSVIHFAALGGSVETLKEVNKISSLGTPVQIAAVTLQLDTLKLLLESGADPNMLAGQAVSVASPFPPALILAASKGANDVVKLLLEKGADPDCTDSEGFTPLHCAAEANSLTCSQLLLDYGADWGAVARDGTTPLDLARRHNSTAVAKQLEALGVNPNPKRPVLFPPVASPEHQPASSSASEGEACRSRVPMVIELDANHKCPKDVMVKVEKLKDEGNAAFRQNKFTLAKEKYSQALNVCPRAEAAKELLAVLYSNRSFVNENLKDAEGALQDAQVATQLRPDWSKAHYRLARAYRLLKNTEEYITELWFALRLDHTKQQIR
ncbi:hypothetical protein ACSSS7_006917 [Eimeria intestinalis]